MYSRLVSGAFAASLTVVSASGQAVPSGYSLVELTPLKESSVTRVNAINNAGQMAGSAQAFLGLPPESSAPVLWDSPSSPMNIDPDGIVFGASVATDVNDQGLVRFREAGVSGSTEYVRGPDGGNFLIPVPSETLSGISDSLSALGNVAGVATEDNLASVLQYFVGGFGFGTPTIEFTQFSPDGFYSFPVINDAGYIATGTVAPGTGSAGFTVVDTRGVQGTDFRGSPNQPFFAQPLDLNNRLTLVGVIAEQSGPNPGLSVGVLSARGASPVVLPTIGCPPGRETECAGIVGGGDAALMPRAINERGVAVGHSARVATNSGGDLSFEGEAAFIWSEATGTIELSTLVQDGSAAGWTLNEATDINESGVIVGNGINPFGDERAFMLVPREPCAADTNRNGIVEPGDFGAWVAAYNLGCDPTE